ncbi:hypothetical protein GCM10007887_32420 [Methylobacterium haplocladii]|uniref:Uncharacterized protein n=1 Tax=Methylobacterium haplocladii TaxID=1176176 RepID=A0A512IMZ9_9HYPH|nr:hypothetical protein MHA02_14460 [Methylobacterium haplocladii]GLS60561.1 hypothetical protein GCM10007887_32420 [Methylobacterium haplocladii]
MVPFRHEMLMREPRQQAVEEHDVLDEASRGRRAGAGAMRRAIRVDEPGTDDPRIATRIESSERGWDAVSGHLGIGIQEQDRPGSAHRHTLIAGFAEAEIVRVPPNSESEPIAIEAVGRAVGGSVVDDDDM